MRSAAREKNIWNSSDDNDERLSWDPVLTGVVVATGAGKRWVLRMRRCSSSLGDKVMLKSYSTVSAARGASKHERGFEVMIRAPGASGHRRKRVIPCGIVMRGFEARLACGAEEREGRRGKTFIYKKGRNVREKECIYIRDDSQTIRLNTH